jgi:Histidine kinase-like ATPase domain
MTADPARLAGSPVGVAGNRWLAPAVEMAAVASGNWPLSPQPGPDGWTCFPRVATRTPGVDARPVRAARDFAIATVRRWGAAHRCDDIGIVVSELVTNALRHALPDSGETPPVRPIRLGLLQPGPCVLCAVADPSRRAPVAKHVGTLAETGRGLYVVGTLADIWGFTTPGDTGKIVWAMFSTDRAPSRASSHPVPRGHQHAASAGLEPLLRPDLITR